MKKYLVSIFFVLTLVMFVSPAFALQCKTGNYGSDECWTTGQTRTNDAAEAYKVGTVFVYDFTTPVAQGNDADEAAFYVRSATTSDQGNIIAGVLQNATDVSSGDRVQLLVRGQGQLRVNTAVTSQDRLFLWGSSTNLRGLATTVHPLLTQAASKDRSMAFALETAAAAATIDAYITLV